MNRLTATAFGVALPLLGACATTGAATQQIVEEDYKVSVEIPLGELRLEEDEILQVDELLDERTEFDAEDFQLDEVVLVARADEDAVASAELLVLEWRSGAVDIPAGGEEDWYEVRIPAPDEDPGGAWLLDLNGAMTVDFLVVVMEPRPRVVAEHRTRTRTVYRTVDRTRYAYDTYWIYDPTRYYVYHYHDSLWPYRYFSGVWDFRYYDLRFRPTIHRFGIYTGPRYSDGWRDGYYRGWRDGDRWNDRQRARERQDRRQRHRNVAPRRLEGWRDRRASSHLATLRRDHPRYGDARRERRRSRGDFDERRTEEARERYEQMTRSAADRSGAGRGNPGASDSAPPGRRSFARSQPDPAAALPPLRPTSQGQAPTSTRAARRFERTESNPAQATQRRTAPRSFDRQGAEREGPRTVQQPAPTVREANPRLRSANLRRSQARSAAPRDNARAGAFQRRSQTPAATQRAAVPARTNPTRAVARPQRQSAPRTFERAPRQAEPRIYTPPRTVNRPQRRAEPRPQPQSRPAPTRRVETRPPPTQPAQRSSPRTQRSESSNPRLRNFERR